MYNKDEMSRPCCTTSNLPKCVATELTQPSIPAADSHPYPISRHQPFSLIAFFILMTQFNDTSEISFKVLFGSEWL